MIPTPRRFQFRPARQVFSMSGPAPSRAITFFRRHVWLRNLVFCGVCLFGLGAAMAALLQSNPPEASLKAAPPSPDADFDKTVAEIDQLFADHWRVEGLQPAPQADPLTLLRRVSLGLIGT